MESEGGANICHLGHRCDGVLLGKNIGEALSSDEINGFSNINSDSPHDGNVDFTYMYPSIELGRGLSGAYYYHSSAFHPYYRSILAAELHVYSGQFP